MLPQAACACEWACNSACDMCQSYLEFVWVCVTWEDDCFGQLWLDRFDPPGLWVPSPNKPNSSVSFRTLVHSQVFVVLCRRMCGNRERTVAVRFTESDRFRLSRA